MALYEIHELLLNKYGSVALEKALELTTGQKLPVKGYYSHMKKVLEGFKSDAGDKRQRFIAKQEISFLRKTSSVKYFLRKSS